MSLGKNIFKLGFISVKVLAGTLGSFAVGAAPSIAHTTSSSSPLLGQSRSSQNAVNILIDAISSTSQGPLNTSNIAEAIREVAANSTGFNAEHWVAALNRLELSGEALGNAVGAVGGVLEIPQEAIVSSLLVDTFSTQGSARAQEQLSDLRFAVGESIVNDALVAPSVGTVTMDSGRKVNEANSGHDGIYDG